MADFLGDFLSLLEAFFEAGSIALQSLSPFHFNFNFWDIFKPFFGQFLILLYRPPDHLKISSRHLNLAQYLLLDQALFVAVLLLSVYCFCKKIGQIVLGKKSKSGTDKKDV